jgi:sulfur carrier protein
MKYNKGMEIVLNGEKKQITDQISVEALLRHLNSPLEGVAVAVNGNIIPRSKWHQEKLENKDKVEILGAVQGG